MTYEKYLKKYIKDNQKVADEQKGILDEQATATRDNINASADKSITDIETSYGTQIQDANEAAEIAHRKNEMRKILNERHLERKAAEIGLTDSSFNRTQLTANQLSYGNNKSDIDTTRQKTVDTLAAAMASKVADVNIDRNARLSEVDTNLASAKNQIDSTLQSSAEKYASDMYKTDLENASKYNYIYDDKGNVTSQFTAEERKNAWNNLVSAFELQAISDPNEAARLIYEFGDTYDLSDAERAILLNKANLTPADLENYIRSNNTSVYISSKDYENGQSGKLQDYKTAGAQRYYFKLKKATNNWGGGVDNDDEVDIYYADGTLLAENVRIDQLPTTEYRDKWSEQYRGAEENTPISVQQSITNRTKGKKKDYEFYMTVDLKGLNI